MKLANQLKKYLRENHDWTPKGRLLRITWHNPDGTTYMPDTVGRTLRNMEADSVIAVKPDRSKSVSYKFLPPDRIERYIPWSERPDNAKFVLFKV